MSRAGKPPSPPEDLRPRPARSHLFSLCRGIAHGYRRPIRRSISACGRRSTMGRPWGQRCGSRTPAKLRQQVLRLGAGQRPVLLDRGLAGEGGGGPLAQALAGGAAVREIGEELAHHLRGARRGQRRRDARARGRWSRRRARARGPGPPARPRLPRPAPPGPAAAPRPPGGAAAAPGPVGPAASRRSKSTRSWATCWSMSTSPSSSSSTRYVVTVLADVTTPACGGRAVASLIGREGSASRTPGPPPAVPGGRAGRSRGGVACPTGLCRRQRDHAADRRPGRGGATRAAASACVRTEVTASRVGEADLGLGGVDVDVDLARWEPVRWR